MKTLVFAWVLGFAVSASALDLTVHRESPPGAGAGVERTYILNGTNKVYLRIPSDWQANGDAQTLTLATNRPQTTVRIEQAAAAKPVTFDEAGKTALRQQAMGLLPAGAKDVVPVSEETDVTPHEGWTSLETIVSYNAYGTSMQQAVLTINMGANQLMRVRVLARKDDFADIHKKTLGILSSWFEPAKDLPPDLNSRYETNTGGA